MRAAVPLERDIQRSVLDLLALLKIRAWRINQQGVPLHNGSGKYRPGPTRGMSDVIAALPPNGRWLAVEIKRPGKKATPAQQKFLDQVNSVGGLAFVATSADEVRRVLIENGVVKA